MQFRTLAILTNLAAAAVLAVLLALGAYASTVKRFIGHLSTPGYAVIHLDTTY